MPHPKSKPIKTVCGFMVGIGVGLLPLVYLADFGRASRGVSVVSDYNPPPHLSDRRVFRIVAFGSSSTHGVGASSVRTTYPARLGRLLAAHSGVDEPVEVVNRGIDGQDIRDMMKRLQTDILSRKPSLVIWQAGSNDSINQVPLREFEADLKQGIAAIRASGAELMLMEPQWAPRLEQADASNRYLDAVQRIARTENVPLIPRYELMQQWISSGLVTEHDLIGPDGLHMTDRGYELLSQAVFDDLVDRSAAFRQTVALRTTLD